jgi:CubicO group peptidase (beta-lactamase class C family)
MMRRYAASLYPWILPLVIAAALLLGSAGSGTSAPEQETRREYERVAQMINKHIRTNHIPGISLGIVREGQVDYLEVFGTAGGGVDMAVETPMFIASLSKPVTAFAVMQLVEAGEIDLDTPVRDYISWFAVADPEISGRITVRHLLNQTSGLSDLGYMPDLPTNASIEEAVRALSQAEPSAEPGERFFYFNGNYTTLGHLIEVVSGQSYMVYMREQVFEPLDMNNTFTSIQDAQRAGLAQGHIAVFGYPVPRRQVFRNFDLPSGFILSTAEDLSRFLIPQLEGGVYNGRQFLSPESIALMHSLPEGIDSSYGMGWWVGPEDLEPRQLQHGGDLDSFHGDMVLLPDHRLGFVILYNQNHLIYSLVTFNKIRDGTISLLTGGPEPFTISLTFFYRIAMILFLFHIILVVRSFARLPRWERRARHWSLERKVLNIAANFMVTFVLLVSLPVLVVPVIGRGFDWVLLFNRLPILVTWLFFVIVISSAYGLGKLWLILKRRADDPRREQQQEAV